jgi:hypothetical protein
VPVQTESAGNVPDAGVATPTADIEGKASGIAGIVRQEVELLLFHRAAVPAPDATYFQLQVDAEGTAGQVADYSSVLVIVGPNDRATGPATSFFPRRFSTTTRANGSPRRSSGVRSGRKPGKA